MNSDIFEPMLLSFLSSVLMPVYQRSHDTAKNLGSMAAICLNLLFTRQATYRLKYSSTTVRSAYVWSANVA
jgi:hypothetical protein